MVRLITALLVSSIAFACVAIFLVKVDVARTAISRRITKGWAPPAQVCASSALPSDDCCEARHQAALRPDSRSYIALLFIATEVN
jgi:hypothetical protein